MALNYRSVDRDQSFLVPPDMRDWLPPNHLAWFLLEVVEQLNTSALHDKSKRGGTGREGYDPDLLLAVWIYASARGISSSRQIERACTEDVAFRVLCAQDVPDHTVLARFRQRHRDVMADLFGQVLVLCVRQGLGKFGVVAIDGTKIKSNASKDKSRSLKTLRAMAKDILDTAEATDAAEDRANAPTADDDLPGGFGPGPGRPALIRAELAGVNRPAAAAVEQAPAPQVGGAKLARIEAAIAQLESVVKDENDPWIAVFQTRLLAAQKRLSDVEAKQAASCARYAIRPVGRRPVSNNAKLLAARHGVVHAQKNLERAQTRAGQQLSGEVAKTRRYLLRRNVTDPESRLMHTRSGFIEAYNGQVATTDDQLIIAVDVVSEVNDQAQLIPMMEHVRANIERCQAATTRTDLTVGVVVADNGYLSAENVAADGYARLLAPGRGTMKDGKWVGSIAGRPGDTISRAAETMVHTLAEPGNQKLYNRRGVLVEPVNAFLKDRRGLRQLACRGHQAANAELHFAALTTNLMKLFTAGLTANPATN